MSPRRDDATDLLPIDTTDLMDAQPVPRIGADSRYYLIRVRRLNQWYHLKTATFRKGVIHDPKIFGW
ncbi:hypothetical protein FJZ31_30400 [Candidatus Poribacteria bacterium]|nr:hypothetical protein [Candidatus Poribacteria bacterium]